MNIYYRSKVRYKMTFILEYQWQLFITLEVLSWIMLLIFGGVRYWFQKRKISTFFLALFIFLLALEGALALAVYNETGKISQFHIVIIIFLLYACTFGIIDFLKLDRWMRLKIGGWRHIDMLSDKDKRIIAKQKNPKYIAKKYRISSLIHTTIFLIVQIAFWLHGTGSLQAMIPYLTDWSWTGTENVELTPYGNEKIYYGSMVWGIVFAIDFIWSWSYTLFPSKPKE